MNFNALDLNLIRIFDALMRECGLSLADTRALVAPLTTMETAWLLSGLIHECRRSGTTARAAKDAVLAELLACDPVQRLSDILARADAAGRSIVPIFPAVYTDPLRVSVAREPGARSKIAVTSRDDPYGAPARTAQMAADWGAEVDQYYRHLYMMKSEDNGENWSDPYEITAPPYVSEDFVPFLECVWPAVPRHIGSKAWVLYQQDGLPGTDQWGDNHSAGDNAINFIEVPLDSIPAFVGVFNPPAPDAAFDLQLAPNPAVTVTQLSATLTGNEPALVEIIDLNGRLARQFRLPVNGSGRQILSLPVQNLAAGVYSVRVSQSGRFGVTKLLKH